MNNVQVSRRRFMGAILTSGAAIPLRKYSWAFPSKSSLTSEKKIDWGYPEDAVRLNSNENPLGPSPLALRIMEKALLHAHRYTVDSQLKKELASYHKVSSDSILAGCGSTEFLRIAPWTFLRDGGEVVTSLQTYQTLIRECKKIDANVHSIPLNRTFSFDLQSIKKKITPKTKMVYLVNPNNPTGTSLPFEEIQKFCASIPEDILVFIDEAYSQFLEDRRGRSGVTLIKQGYKVVVSRTFSKVYGLAGARLGYVISQPAIIKELEVFGFGDMGVNQVAFAGGLASIEDERHVEKYKNLVVEGKEFFYREFESMGLEYIPSVTPFLMVRLNISSKVAWKRLASKHVYVRKGEDWYLPGYLRISIGFPKENKACIEALKKILITPPS